MLTCRWDPALRMTPDEALQHDWIKEGLVHRKDRVLKSQHRQRHASPGSESQPDPYKVPAQPPVKGTARPLQGPCTAPC